MAAEDSPGADDFDVVLVHGPTEDGAGARVLRARPGKVETGEVRPMESGRAMTPGTQVVQLSPRGASRALYDVKVEYEAAKSDTETGLKATPPPPRGQGHGPAQVATRAYRESWERTFRPAKPN